MGTDQERGELHEPQESQTKEFMGKQYETVEANVVGSAVDPVAKPGKTRIIAQAEADETIPKWGTAQFNARKHLILTVDGTGEIFVFNADEISEIHLGRFDPQSGEVPEVDLTRFGAVEKGVSRKHASIVRRDGSLSIVDHESQNGTFLNGHKLVAHQARILRNGDDLRLGKLVLRVSFAQA